MSQIKKAIILPGNGCPGEGTDLSSYGWYGWLAAQLQERGIHCKPSGFPEPLRAFEHVWKEHCINTLGMDSNTLIIGHSSGAACALRLMEDHKTAGCILVSAYDSDLGDELERESGYFNRPFNYQAMKSNTPFIHQFHSLDDHLVPVNFARNIANGLQGKVQYHESSDDGHFNTSSVYPTILQAIDREIEKFNK